MADHAFRPETLAIHAGQIPDASTGARALPIYQTTSFVFDSAEHAAALFNLQTFGNIYTRLSNPTTAVFEERMAALEGGRAALATASGLAAQMTALLTLCEAGDEIVAARTLYGGSYSQLDVSLRKLGIRTVFVDPEAPENFRRAITGRTRCIYGEIIGNPRLNVLDVAPIAAIAHEHGVPLVVDNTLASPWLCRPFEHGADIVVHSATKYIGGHGTTLGGLIVDSGKFPWATHQDRYPMFNEPEASYHGVVYVDALGPAAYIGRARTVPLRNTGSALSPFNAFQLLQGMETLPLRMQRHCENAQRVAEYLQSHKAIQWVRYAGLKDHPHHSLAQKYMKGRAAGLLTFGVNGGFAAGVKLYDALKLFKRLVNIGDAKSLACHPASTTHRQLSEAEQRNVGVTPEAIRLSVGIEDIEDILGDLDQALAAATA